MLGSKPCSDFQDAHAKVVKSPSHVAHSLAHRWAFQSGRGEVSDHGLKLSPTALAFSPGCTESLSGDREAASSWWMPCLETAPAAGLTEEVLRELTQESIQVICRRRRRGRDKFSDNHRTP